MKNENYNDIENFFKESVQLPEDLSPENIAKKLETEKPKEEKKSKITLFPKIIAAAAAVAVVSVGIFAGTSLNYKPEKASPVPESTTADLQLDPKHYFKDESDLKKYFLKVEKRIEKNRGEAYNYSADYVMEAKQDITAIGTDAFAGLGQASASNVSSSKTNTQVDGVDEADIIKNDERYIYIVSQSSFLTIVDTQSMKKVFREELKSTDSDKDFSVANIYLNGNTLVAVCEEYEDPYKYDENSNGTGKYVTSCCYMVRNADTVNIVFDISDKANPKELRRVKQSGNLTSTRMVGSILYTTTEYNVLTQENKKNEDYIPKINGKSMDCDDIYIAKRSDYSSYYTVITAFDTANENEEIQKMSYLGVSDNVYCTNSEIYILGTTWKKADNLGEEQEYTTITAYTIDGTKLSFKASSSVPGSVESQYNLDAKDGYLRIATNLYDSKHDKDISSLYILDESLKITGKLTDIAPDEQIEAVRYLGNMAYIVTFKNTDPIFAIDLSDPAQPKIIGQLSLPGFSEYLHPVGDNLLVGVGRDGDDEDADYESVKISLFDISDPTSPKEVDRRVIKDASTDVSMYDGAKAFLYYAEKNIIGIPICKDSFDETGNWHGSYYFDLLSIKDGKFADITQYAQPKITYENGDDCTYSFHRGVYIDNQLYTVTDYNIAQFKIGDSTRLDFLQYAKPDPIM